MSYLWSIEDLSRLIGSSEPKVMAWACERLKTLYGKEGIAALEGLLKERDEDVLEEALDYLLEYPSPQFADTVLEIYKREKGYIAGKAAMVMARLRDERILGAFSEKEMEMSREGFKELFAGYEAMGELGTENAVAFLKEAVEEAGEKAEPVSLKLMMTHILRSGKGLDFVLDFYFRHYKDLGAPVVSALLDYCRFWHSYEEPSEGKKMFFKERLPEVIEDAVSMLNANADGDIGKELERLFRKGDYYGVIASVSGYADNLVKKAAAHAGEKAFSEWKARDSQPKKNYDLITALHNLQSYPKEAGKGLAIVAIASLAGLYEMKSLIGLSADAGAKTLLDSFLEDREDAVDDRWIEDVLLDSPEKETIVTETIRIIQLRPNSLGAKRGIRLLGLMGDERAIPCLIEVINVNSNDFEDRAIDEAIYGLVRFGEKALPALEMMLKDADEDAMRELFFVLKDIPVKRVEELLIKNWDRFMAINRDFFTMALEGVASKEFIPLLRQEIKEDELIEAGAFYLLCLIHEVKDPLLPGIREQLKKQDEELKDVVGKLMDNDLTSEAEKPLRLELKCLKCGRSYFYKVEEVVINPENPYASPYITDTITCKNCGSVNNYEITYNGSASIMIRLKMMIDSMKKGKKDKPLPGPIKFARMRFMGDKPATSFKEAIEEYKKALKKDPDDPGLHIGYGNMLKKNKQIDEAEEQYHEAARLEPNAVEALIQLGEIAEERGDIHAAYEYYDKALQRMPFARYFRTPDVEIFKQIVVEKHHYLREQVKGKATNLIEGIVKVEPQRKKKVGRNDPCPCGSGKKYKKCCLPKDEAERHKTTVTPVESSIMDRLLLYSRSPRFNKEFKDAYYIYFRTPFREPIILDEEKEKEFGSFLEWFIHDHLLENGKTIIEEFYQENFHRLSEEERDVLNAEMTSYPSVYEVTAVAPEEGMSLKDLFTGEELEVKEVKGSRVLVKWDIVITRVIRHEKVNKLSGLATILPRDDKDRFMAALSAKWEGFKKETGKEDWCAFMKMRGYLLHQIHSERVTPKPVFFTEEHHPVIGAKAEYDVINFKEIRSRLSNEFDFVLDDEKEGKELKYTWLKRGRSEKWEEVALPEAEGIRPIVVQSQFIGPSEKIRFTELGSIRATPHSLTLECISKERLERGKARLKEVLGSLVRHKGDSFQKFEATGSKKERISNKTEVRIDDAEKLSLMSRYYSQYVEDWINNPLPALGGISPLESYKTEAGRAKVDELLKDLENNEERKRRNGQPYMDVSKIRERLKQNIPKTSS